MARFPSLTGLALVTLLSMASSARADVIGPPPDGCPEGTTAIASHCPVCSPDACTADADCETDQHCAERSYCTIVYETCGGWGGSGATDARTACGPSTACATDSPCTLHRVCVPGASTTTDASGTDAGDGREVVSYGCGCRAGSGGGASAAWLAALVALALVARRR